jgi:CheY-like chemotaxis protein
MRALILGLLEEDDNAHQVIESLTKSGHAVHAVDTFTKAIAMFTTEHEPVDLIISDVHLENGGNVFDFMKWVKRNPRTSDIPFVLFSFHPADRAKYLEDGVKTSARLLGAAKYITMDKFDSDEFRKQIDSLLPRGAQIVAIQQPADSGE